MKRAGMIDAGLQLTWAALRSAETDRVAPGMDAYWILHTVSTPALHGAIRRQLFREWLQAYSSRTN